MKVNGQLILLLAFVLVECARASKTLYSSPSPRRAFLRPTQEVATWNRLQQVASASSAASAEEADDQLVLPAFYRGSHSDIESMREVVFAYDRHRSANGPQSLTELEFLENTVHRGR